MERGNLSPFADLYQDPIRLGYRADAPGEGVQRMNAQTLLTLSDHHAALTKARTSGQAPLPLQGLNAPIASDIDKWFRRIWDNVEQIVVETYKGARERAEQIRDEVMIVWSHAQQELGARSEELRTRV